MLDTTQLVSKKIGAYSVTGELARSERNCVLLAEEAGRIVVIKLMFAELTSERERERFLREVRLQQMLRHPHILPILDYGVFLEHPYIVSEYLSGGSLREYLDRQAGQAIPLQERLYLLVQVGQALYHAHTRNILHGNLKPENVLLNAQGQAMLADFRIETALGTGFHEQAYKSSSYAYMAPEQFKGVVSKASDQYEFACIAYELLTGQTPFHGTDFAEMALRHANDEPVALTRLNLLLAVRYEEAILRGMAKSSAGRFETVEDLLKALGSSTTFRANSQPDKRAGLPVPADMIRQGREVAVQASRPQEGQRSVVINGREKEGAAGRSQPRTRVPVAMVDTFVEEPVAGTFAGVQNQDETVVQQGVPVNSSLHASRRVTAKRSSWVVLAVSCIVAFGMVAGLFLLATFALHRTDRRISLQTPTATLSYTPVVSPTVGVVITSTSQVRPTASPPSMIPTPKPTPTMKPTPTQQPSPSPRPSPAPSPTPSPAPSPTLSPTPSPTPVPYLTVYPTGFNVQQDCYLYASEYVCLVTLSLSASYSGSLKWTASASGLSANTYPWKGILSPGLSVVVNILASPVCPTTGYVYFNTAIATATVTLSC
ncbi:MAG TPA: serine/threonine-protein kinase [Ktedonobacteraceae bacterium]|nr:serine/threonine-protein kinase [Ktedonobacteraceae bacterium]